MAKIKHKHICRFHDTVVVGQKLYIVMELCDKGDLSAYLERSKKG
jgi:serine/threonine protein kinase